MSVLSIPVELVGSMPRPAVLQKAYADYDAGSIQLAELERLQDAACKDTIERFVIMPLELKLVLMIGT